MFSARSNRYPCWNDQVFSLMLLVVLTREFTHETLNSDPTEKHKQKVCATITPINKISVILLNPWIVNSVVYWYCSLVLMLYIVQDYVRTKIQGMVFSHGITWGDVFCSVWITRMPNIEIQVLWVQYFSLFNPKPDVNEVMWLLWSPFCDAIMDGSAQHTVLTLSKQTLEILYYKFSINNAWCQSFNTGVLWDANLGIRRTYTICI